MTPFFTIWKDGVKEVKVVSPSSLNKLRDDWVPDALPGRTPVNQPHDRTFLIPYPAYHIPPSPPFSLPLVPTLL